MSDPLSDPRAEDLLTADPGEVQSLSDQFSRIATAAQTAIGGLHGAHGDATWTGGAAEAFRAKLGKLPGELQKVQHSYGQAAAALSTYGGELDPLRRHFQTLAPQLRSAQGAVQTAQTSLTTARGDYTTASQASKAKPTSPAVISAHTALTTANGALSTAQGHLDGLNRQAYSILDQFETLRGQARSALSAAAAIAPQDQSSWFSSLVSGFVDVVKDAGGFVASMAVGVYDAACRLPHDFAEVWDHPFSLEAWSHLAGDLSTVVGTIALAAAIIVCPLDAVGFEGAAAAFGTLDTVADGTATGLTALKTAFDGGLVAEGKGSVGELVSDGTSLGASFIKVPGLKSARASAQSLEDGSEGLERYAAGRESGMTASQAYSALSETQRTGLRSTLSALHDSHGLSYVQSTLSDATRVAKTGERRLDALNGAVHWTPDRAKEVATHPDENSWDPVPVS